MRLLKSNQSRKQGSGEGGVRFQQDNCIFAGCSNYRRILDMILPKELETDRLILRPHTQADFEGFYTFLSDENATRFLSFTPEEKTRQGATAFFNTMLDSYQSTEPIFGMAILEKGTRNYIGSCGLSALSDSQAAETVLLILPDAWGKGYATEVGMVLVEYAFSMPGIDSVVSFADPQHPASRRVSEKLGMAEIGLVDHKEYPHQVVKYELTKEAFLSETME
ncbi:GNAT family N-acetyltransferase [Pontibacter sp. G13]|uniref:GNAT family N-acetyltransferase n=1 Tax=Pontibacter sp. G13 TaxID=3074898 RepID=UPI00288989A7|nr:GNAT family N-acetyltransferase [Pontibacter sp. G13]WNJ19844.1 GNAT family N-acetyltransferase [Pontibacter sp. G13]